MSAWRPRPGPGALTVAAHMLLALALLRHAGMPQRGVDDTPADYVTVAVIPAPQAPAPRVERAASAIAVPVRRQRPSMPVRTRETTPAPATAPPVAVLPESEAHAAAPPQPAQPARIDMLSLRAAARQADSERTVTPDERRRASGQLRASDDSALGQAIREAKRPDCQTRYAGGETNLLLLIPLAVETVTGKGCKW